MNPYLLPVVDFGPKVIARTFAQIPAVSWDIPTAPGRFTPREVIAHLADWEPILLARMQTALERSGTTIEAYDEGLMAEENGYRHLDPQEQIRLFIERRATTTTWLRDLPAGAFSRSVLHPERGVMTIEDQANMLLGHDLYHIEQLTACLEGNANA